MVPRHSSLIDDSLQVFWDDGARVFGRGAWLDAEGRRNAVLAMLLTAERPPRASLDRLAHEHALKNELDRAWAVRPLALVLDRGRSMLVLEDPGGEPLDLLMSRLREAGPDLSRLLPVACELASAVGQMHGRGFVHRDIKPANCFVDPEGRVKLTGFGLASRSAAAATDREGSEARTVETVAGTFAYMAPEQTGRMNRPVDARSDLYALGVVLFELFTGTLPFVADDALEWAHRHIASRPPPPSARAPSLPPQIDTIILKLLAKNPDDRYQAAKSVEADLRRCLAEWMATHRVGPFLPAQSEIAHRPLISGTLYGRGESVEILQRAAERVMAGGACELVLVSGSAGVGKSSLVDELHRRLASRTVLFASGKFDQYQRDIPYSTLAQAFRGLVRQLLAKPESELAAWRRALLEALDPNGQLMVDLIPELAFVIGPQPPAPPVELSSAQVRFHFVFRSLLGVFARAEHPLVLFIDDLQWLDGATLELLQRVVTDPGLLHVLVVGAYRDDEVGESHPLTRTLGEIRLARAALSEIHLEALTPGDLGQLLADILACDARRAEPLARLVDEKTGGNPFFAVQFIRELVADGSLSFQPASARWSWDVSRIRAKGMTDNVAHLLSLRLGRLPPGTQAALGALSLLGNQADIRLMALIRGASEEEARATLQPAVEAGLVVDADGTFSFVHDHVQAAAYASVPPEERPVAHLGIGRLLLSRTADSDLEERVFEITSQFDHGLSRITSTEEKVRVAGLYLLAGKRAKAASAYPAARACFEKGRQLLGGDGWDGRHRLLFELELNRAECEIVDGELERAEARLDALALGATGFADQAEIVCLAVLLYFTTGRSDRAVEAGVGFLSRAGIDWPLNPTEVEVRREFEEMHRRLAGRPIATLIDLPEMSDPATVAVMSVMTELFPAAYAVDRRLMELVLLRMVNLSLAHGNCESSSIAYSALNMAVGVQFGDYATACSFGELGRELVDRRRTGRYRARVYSLSAAFAMPWIRPLSTTGPLMTEAYRISSSVGDLAFAAYNNRNRITHMLVMGTPLGHVQHMAEEAVSFARKIQLGLPAERFFGQLELIRRIRGVGVGVGGGETPDDDGWAEGDVQDRPGLAMMVCYHWVFRLQEHYFAANIAAALAAAAHVADSRWAMRSSIEEAEYDFYAGLAAAAAAESDGASAAQRRSHIVALSAHHARLALWASNCPATFACREALLGAELARLGGDDAQAQALYEKAIRLARDDGFVQVEAIANELAGQFYAARGLDTAADAYLRNARDGYERWGCLVKIRQLDFRHPRVGRRQATAVSAATIDAPVASLDVEVVGRASRALSSEMVLTSLLEKLMRLAVQHAGAERGLLLLLEGGALNIEAQAVTERGAVEVEIARRRPAETDLPQSVLQYVLRTQQPIVLDDGASEGLDPADPYLRHNKPRSILCLPIFRETLLIGALYVENSLASGVFSPNRVAVLDFLASQAGIWLENARLYSDLQRSETWLREAQRLSRTGSFYWRDDLDTLECSDELFEICGLDPSRVVTVGDVAGRVHPGDLEVFQDLIGKARTSGADINRQFRLQMTDRTVKHVRLVAHSRRDRDGRRMHIGSLQDVTDIQRAQDALGKVRSELAHVSRTATLGVLTASIAHEVNQPLLGIVTNATTCQLMLASDTPNIEGARRTAQRCVRDGNRAAEMIRRLRSLFSNKEAASEPVDLNEVVRDVLALARSELQDNQVVVQTDLVQGLPLVMADRVQIQQVVLNLVLNATDAMAAIADRPRTIVLGTRPADSGAVQVDVRDAGVGFDADSVERLFDAFYTTKDKGMGVGLSVSRSIIESFGGRLWAALNDGPGATFSFTLPRLAPQDRPPRSAPGPAPLPSLDAAP